jgi:hypothetical protein
VEGKILSALTRRPGLEQAVAQLLAWIGNKVSQVDVPDFTTRINTMSPRDFFLLARTLESTARQSYARMVELADVLSELHDSQGYAVQFKKLAIRLQRTLDDECFHESAFVVMANWIAPSGEFDRSLRGKACSRDIWRLLPRSAKAAGNIDSPDVLTDGGLGKLFADYGLPVNVVEA